MQPRRLTFSLELFVRHALRALYRNLVCNCIYRSVLRCFAGRPYNGGRGGRPSGLSGG